jgi:uncharacterized protein (TIGR02284 family)
MPSGREHDIDQLNSLLEATLDSAQGYGDAADAAKNSRVSGLFRTRAQVRHEIAERLEARVKALGGEPAGSGTVAGSARRWFADLKQKVSGDDSSLVADVSAGEDHLKDVYQKVVLDGELSDPIRAAVESEFVQIQADHDEMLDMR